MKQLKFGDMIMIALILLAAISLFIYYQYTNSTSSAEQVIIEVDGEVIKTFDLPQNELVQYKVQIDEDDYNLVEIVGNRVRLKEATCPDQVCVKEGWISKAGEALICLPHKLVVKISGELVEDDGVDVKSF